MIGRSLSRLFSSAPETSRRPEPATATASFRIWGCRGSTPAPGVDTTRYGGDTTCFEVVAPCGGVLAIDCGSGLRRLGAGWAARRAAPERLDVLLSHLHLDHLLGLSFFAPLLANRVAVTLWTAADPTAVETALRRLFAPPFLPIDLFSETRLEVAALPRGPAEIGPFAVDAFPLNHPGGATGFAVGVGERRIVTAVDHEHGRADIDAGLVAAAREADLLVYDAAFTDAEYETHRGWGHSTYHAGAALAAEAAAKRLLFVHHQPDASDEALDRIAGRLSALSPIAALGRDGDRIEL